MLPRETPTATGSTRQQRAVFSSVLAIPVALFLLAFAVRIVGLTWGLPSAERWYSYHPDERDIAITALLRLDFFAGDFNPNFYNYPSLFIYLTYLAHTTAAMMGLTHQAQPGSNAIWPFLYDVLLAGRTLTALFGAATVPLLYSIGRRAAGTGAGVLAALFLALAPGHVQHSHFATVDVPATFFVTLSLWFTARGLAHNAASDDVATARWNTRQLLLAAGAAGLAAATKYNAGMVVLAPLMALALSRRALPQQSMYGVKVTAGIIGFALLGFTIGCPGSVLYTREFLGTGRYTGVLYELFVHSREGSGDIFVGSGNGWWYHLTFNLPFLMTWPLMAAALLGAGCVLSTPPRTAAKDDTRHVMQRSALLILLAWALVYFLSTGLSQVRFMRYMLPIVPVLCVLAAVGVARLPLSMVVRRGVAAGLALVALIGTYNVLYPFVAVDPRDAAAAFLKREAVAPTTVGLIEPPWFWSPPLTPQDAPPPRVEAPATVSADGRYRFRFIGFDPAQLGLQRPEWFVMSEFEWTDKERLRNPAYTAFAQALRSEYELVRSFKNQPALTLPGRNFVPHDFLYTNPEVRIYRRRSPSGKP